MSKAYAAKVLDFSRFSLSFDDEALSRFEAALHSADRAISLQIGDLRQWIRNAEAVGVGADHVREMAGHSIAGLERDLFEIRAILDSLDQISGR